MKDFKRFAFVVAEGREYDSEYDGRMYTYCGFCEACLSEGAPHDDDCDMLEAQRELAEEWEDHLEEVRQEEMAQMRAMYPPSKPATVYTNCPTCNKKVAETGMKQHQETSLKCNEIRTGIKCILPDNPLTHDPKKGTMRKCKQCKKGMPNAHPNKQFCSNKGKGNCKDRYHNRHNPRSGFNEDDYDHEHGHIFASGADGHGQE